MVICACSMMAKSTERPRTVPEYTIVPTWVVPWVGLAAVRIGQLLRGVGGFGVVLAAVYNACVSSQVESHGHMVSWSRQVCWCCSGSDACNFMLHVARLTTSIVTVTATPTMDRNATMGVRSPI